MVDNTQIKQKATFNAEERKVFQSGLKEFIKRVDECTKTGTTKGSNKSTLIAIFHECLNRIKYEANVEFGRGNLKSICGLGFVRKDILRSDCVNTEKFTHTKGLYIYFGYIHSEKKYFLVVGGSDNKNNCVADKIIRSDSKEIYYKNLDVEKITDDFLAMVDYFNHFKVDEFKIQNKGYTMNDKTTIPSLNQILYGPPGTGKTYSTIDKALEILGYAKSNDNGKVILDYTKIKQKLQNIADNKKGAGLDLKNLDSKNDRELAKLLFDYYRSPEHNKEQRQIEFVTFHQSFSYEEFVEGIKPKFVKKSKNLSNETETKSKEMIYKVKSGIFKKICKKALKNCDSSNKITLQKIQERIKSNPCVWKVSLGGKQVGEAPLVQKYCFKHNEIRIAHLDKGDGDRVVKPFKDTMQKGDFVGVFSKKSILKAIGIIVGDYKEKEVIGDSFQKIAPFTRTRKVKWLLKNEDIDSGKDLSRPQDAVFDSGIKAKDLFEKIQDRVGYTFDDLPNQITCKDLPKKPYVLIIDEINRGNISKILGELITLIEPSKRIGASDEEKTRGIGNESLEVTLPYSNKSFGVPSNLYIIGTMNTADRSIALLDTALRRRFEFIEMMPECEHKDISTNCEGVNLQELLKTMNERIEFLLDREHKIGHSFFMKINSLSKLREVFKLKIIPLLQEYFYDDYAKIQATLNSNGMIKSFSKQKLEVNLSDDFVDNDKKVYRITDSNMWKKEDFQRIYDSSIKIDENESK